MLKISSAGTSNAGKKNLNEDNFYMNGLYIAANNASSGRIYSDGTQRNIQFYAVFDGLGDGIKSAANLNAEFYEGQDASFAGADMLARLQRHLKTKTEYNIHSYINSYVKKTNKNICEYIKQRDFRTGASFALLCVSGNYAYAYNIGNSKIFLFRDNRLSPVSRNDTQAESLVMSKLISSDIARHTPDNKILTQYLGMFENEKPLNVHTNRIGIRAGDKFLICTDGVCDLPEERIYQILLRDISEQEVITDLMNEAARGGGNENMTAIVVGVNYSDQTQLKRPGLTKPPSNTPTHFPMIIFRNKFEFSAKQIKYILFAIAALILFIVAMSMIFGGGGDDDPNGTSQNQSGSTSGDSSRETGNNVPTTSKFDFDIPTIDPNATLPPDGTTTEIQMPPTDPPTTTRDSGGYVPATTPSPPPVTTLPPTTTEDVGVGTPGDLN